MSQSTITKSGEQPGLQATQREGRLRERGTRIQPGPGDPLASGLSPNAHGQKKKHENRYFVSSLPPSRLTPAQWLLLVRQHWGVENEFHGTLDLAFEEDDHLWIEAHPRGAVVTALLRRVAYNLLTLFRGVTQRSKEKRDKR